MKQLLCLSLTLLAGMGCSATSATGTVTGKVTVGGKPVKGGTISFLLPTADGGVPLSFPIDDNGNYTATDIPYGELLIAVIPAAATINGIDPEAFVKQRMGEAEMAGTPLAVPPPVPVIPPPTVQIPNKYFDPLTSELKFTMDAPQKEHNVEIR